MNKERYIEIGITLGLALIIIATNAIFRSMVRKHASKYDLDLGQRQYVNKYFKFILIIIFIVGLGMIWDVSLKGLSIYFASFFTIVGVALFANWSILSNITASIILFFNSPMKIGSKIEILDGENSVRGTILDITFFTIQIITEDQNIISYPNNLAIQKAIKQFKK